MSNINFNKWVGFAFSVSWWTGYLLTGKPEALIIANIFLGVVLILEVIGGDNE
jgi:hypothetical protein